MTFDAVLVPSGAVLSRSRVRGSTLSFVWILECVGFQIAGHFSMFSSAPMRCGFVRVATAGLFFFTGWGVPLSYGFRV